MRASFSRPAVVQRGGGGQEECDPVLPGDGGGQDAQRGAVPARRARRQVPGAALGRIDQDAGSRDVAMGGRLLQVVGPGDRRSAPCRERLGAAGVAGEPGAHRRTLVDGAADQRVAEMEPARDLRGTDEVACDELVDGGQRRRFAHAGGRGGDVEVERVAHHRGRLGRVSGRLATTRPAPGRWRRRRPAGRSRRRVPRRSGPAAGGRRGCRRFEGRAGRGWRCRRPGRAGPRHRVRVGRARCTRRCPIGSPSRWLRATPHRAGGGGSCPRGAAAHPEGAATGGRRAPGRRRRPSGDPRAPGRGAGCRPGARAAPAPRSRSGSARPRRPAAGRPPATRAGTGRCRPARRGRPPPAGRRRGGPGTRRRHRGRR